MTFVVALCLLFVPSAQADSELAERNATLAHAALGQAHDLLVVWTGRKDSESSLLRSGEGGNRWTVATTAAELYTSLVVVAWLTDTPLYEGLLRETLRDEIRLTSRLAALPDDYDLNRRRFRRSTTDSERIVDGAARYAEGLSQTSALTGPGPWSERMRSIVDAVFLRADVVSGYAEGPLPSDRAAVNGRYLKLLPLLARATGDEGYLYYARRIGDAYCVGIFPGNGGLPTDRWDFVADKPRDREWTLDGGGAALVEGLIDLYETEIRDGSPRAEIYRPAIAGVFDILFRQGQTTGNRLSRRIETDGSGGFNIDRRRASSHESRFLAAAARFSTLSSNPTYLRLATEAASSLASEDEISLQDLDLLSVEIGTEELLARTRADVERAAQTAPSSRIDERADARRLRRLTTLATDAQAGVRLTPWRTDLRWGASIQGHTLHVSLASDEPWEGQILFAEPHALSQAGYPRHYPIDADTRYAVRFPSTNTSAVWQGSYLARGLSVELEGQQPLTFSIVRQP